MDVTSPTGTDAVLAEELCRATSARTDVPVLPGLWGGHPKRTPMLAGHVLTRTLVTHRRRRRFVAVGPQRWIRAAADGQRARGRNVGPLAVAIDETRSAGRLRAGVLHWFDLSAEIARRVIEDAVDWHPHAAETALMLSPDRAVAARL